MCNSYVNQIKFQVAAFTSRGIGPFSDVLKVRPEPSLALSGASQVAITDIDEYMGRHSAESNSGSAWLVPLLVVGLVVFVSALATVALVYVHRQRVKSGGSQVGHHTPANNHPTTSATRCQFLTTLCYDNYFEKHHCFTKKTG